ncbi:MAG TPA: iron ABC transporter permease [Candidatus Saccharimonadales bacterium]|nr:iron ABC transporter permease [Candidatus Saccharimonadales bacterium]
MESKGERRELQLPIGLRVIQLNRVQCMKRYDLNSKTVLFLFLLLAFFAIFLFYPISQLLKGAFIAEHKFTFEYFQMLLASPLQRQALLNSFLIAGLTTFFATVLTLPLAHLLTRFDFRGKTFLSTLLLLPMIMPPFVGAIGLRQLLSRYGSLNLLLMKIGLVSSDAPVDWLGRGGFWGIVALQVLNLYPILFLNLTAAMANVDPGLREAAQNLGAGSWRLFRSVTMPLILPGYFAGAITVFIWAFTDLGTPLIFGYSRVVPVQIFDAVNELNTNPMGYTLVIFVLVLTVVLFLISKRLLASKRYEMLARGHTAGSEQRASARQAALIWIFAGGITLLAVLPHLSVIVQSFSERWFFSITPTQWTVETYAELSRSGLTRSSITNSLFYSSLSAILDLFLGVTIAWLLTRRKIPFSGLLDALAMLPLALPGIVLAFGYVAGFDVKLSWVNPRENPTLLLIISYSVRRLPYIVRSAYAGFQQTSVTLEEASANLGASPFRTLRKITLPLIMANLIAGTILTFSFAMLEVSDGLILAMKEKYFPITKMIYQLMGRIDPNAPSIACALGVVGMIILTCSLFLAGKLLGKKMGQLFRA